MSGAIRELTTPEAMQRFGRLPAQLQVRSLAPDFAHADTHRAPGLEVVHVAYEEAGEVWLHTMHRRAIANGPMRGAISAYGYGGPLATTDDAAFVDRAAAAWQAWAAERGIVAEFCRFHPEIAHENYFRGEVRANRDTVSVDLAAQPIESQYNTLARRKLRRAGDVPVRWSTAAADWRRFAAFYRDAMRAMGAQARYLFDDAYFDAMGTLPGVELCICADGAEWLSAGAYLFQPTPVGVLEYHLGASSAEGHERGTAYRMQHAAAVEGRRRGLASLYLGGGTTPDADNPLLFYKRCFSRRLLPYRVGVAVLDAPRYESLARQQGYDPHAALPDLLFA